MVVKYILENKQARMKRLIYLGVFVAISLTMKAQQTVGLFTQNPGSLDGYVLFSPIPSDTTYLIDKCGYKVHSWWSTNHPGQSVYLLEDGTLLRPGALNNMTFNGGGRGGVIEKFDWNSNLLWTYTISSSTECQHHDLRQLPNGNVLAIVWELKTAAQAIAEGRNPANLGTVLWSEKIIEVEQSGLNTGNIVWEWHVWDHLIQDFDSTKPNFGIVAEHPELININFNSSTTSDWLHCNALDYNEALDQIILSSHNFDEMWIIDHSTTTSQSASHSGGNHGRGGDLMYRWGNPAAYNRGTANDQKFFGQHNVRWIPNGYPGAGSFSVYNNGLGRPGGNYSTVETFVSPIDSAGEYPILANQPYPPLASNWIYTATTPTSFFSQVISGAQRLSNGNTIICEGTKGNFFEIDSANTIVWRYVSPVAQNGTVSQGTNPTMNSVFRCSLYEANYSGLNGQTLTPGDPIELNPLAYTCTMLPTGIMDSKQLNAATVHAGNPFKHELHLYTETDLTNATATLSDLEGRIVDQFQNINLYASNSLSLKINSELSDGIYYLTIKSADKKFNVKLIHQN